jgi:hypothetical protein
MTIEDGSEVIQTQIEKTSAPKGGDLPDGCSRREVGAGNGGLSRAKYINKARGHGGEHHSSGYAIRPVKVRGCE